MDKRVGADFIEKFFRPKARMDILRWLERHNARPHAMIDLSDGLAAGLCQLCEASKMGATLHEGKLPVWEKTKKVAKHAEISHRFAALQGGEDYELLFGLSPEAYRDLPPHEEIHAVGFAHKSPLVRQLISEKRETTPLKPLSFRHF